MKIYGAWILMGLMTIQCLFAPIHAFTKSKYKHDRKTIVQLGMLEAGLAFPISKATPNLRWVDRFEFSWHDKMYDVVSENSEFWLVVDDAVEKKFEAGEGQKYPKGNLLKSPPDLEALNGHGESTSCILYRLLYFGYINIFHPKTYSIILEPPEKIA